MNEKTIVLKLVHNTQESISKDGKALAIEFTDRKVLYFPAAGSIVKAVKDVNNELLFSLVNWYFNDLNDAKKERLYYFYETAVNLVRSDTDNVRVTRRLTALIDSCNDIIDVDVIARWLEQLPGDPAAYKNIIDVYPEEDINESTVDAAGNVGEFINRPGTKVKTILRNEVRDMIALTIISKIIAPPICDYIYKFKPQFLKFIELSLFDIIGELKLFKHRIIDRIYEYISAFIDTTEVKKKLSVVIHGYMSEIEYPDYIISLLITSRLLNATLIPGQGKRTFIPNVLNLCVKDAEEPTRLFGESEHRNKGADTGAKDIGDSERSEFDRISVSFSLSPGQQVMAEWGAQKFIERELFEPDCKHKRLTIYDRNLVDKYLGIDRHKVLNYSCQRAICGIVVNEFFPRTMFDYVSNKPDTQFMNKLYLVSAIWLEQNGFADIAKLQVASGAIDPQYILGIELHNFSSSDIDKLDMIYPSRIDTSVKNQKHQQINLGTVLLDKVVRGFATMRWSDQNGRTVEPPSNFRHQLVEIVSKRGI